VSKRILVVEDTPSAARLVKDTLTQEGYQVTCESNGLVGLQKAQEEHPDLVILDIFLPGLDGLEICRKLRQQRKTSRLPILMLTCKASAADRSTGLLRGANAYLYKPADPETIVANVKALLGDTG